MNFVIAGIVVILIMLCIVAGLMIALVKKLEILEDSLDVIRFGVKDVISDANKIIREDISGIYGVLDKLLEIEKDFDSNIAKGTSELVDVCKNHLCAVQTKCEYTNLKVAAMGKDLETFSEQLSAITDHIREQSVEKESLCDTCKYNDEEGFTNECCDCSEQVYDAVFCNYEPKNAFEQAGDV